ncbi:MAG: hypothetical protein AAGH70_09465 [Pseudomonadota bacterium]
MRAALLSLLLALPSIAVADRPASLAELWEENSDHVRNEDGNVHIMLPGSVRLWRRPDGQGGWEYRTRDESGLGAVGCLAVMVVETKAAAQQCPKFFTASRVASLDRMLDLVVEFYVENAIPPMDGNEVEGAFARWISGEATRCSEDAEMLSQFADQFLLWDGGAALEENLSVPRYPSSNPCF